MTLELVSCQRCGEPFISQRTLHTVLEIVKEKSRNNYGDFFVLCQRCRTQRFAEQLGGDRLEKVERVTYIPKRRQEKLCPVKADARLGTTVYKTECFICNQGCDALVHVKDGEVVRVQGDPSSAVTKGTLCSKGLASKELLYHPDRLLYPMKRMGERGQGRWQRISWDEALDTITRRFNEIEEQYGEHSIVLASGTNRGWIYYFLRFANAYGKQRIGPGVAQCFMPRMTGQILVLGGNAMENPHYDDTQCMVIWGCNPTNTWPVKGLGMMEAWSRGAKMIVVDPVFTEAASKADMWLQLRPGTDAALALGMLQVIINEGLYDKAFVDRWCIGFNELRERVQQYPPERVEEITWIPKNKIKKAAWMYATVKPGSITQCLSIDQNADTISTSRSIAMIAALTGNIDVPGGNLFNMPLKAHKLSIETLSDYLTKEHHEKRLGSKEYPLLAGEASILQPTAHNYTVWQAILTGKPYPVRAIYCQGSNMLVGYSNAKMVREALMSLDFLATADLFMTDTAQIADIVLPAGSWMERSAATHNDQTSINNFHLQQKIVQRGECRTDFEILNELAKRLGFGERMFPTDEAYFDFLLEPSGMTFEEFKKIGVISVPYSFKKYEAKGFNTPAGKVQLYDQRLKALGFDPLPSYREPTESPISTPEVAKEYPLIITTGGRVAVYRHSELRNIPVLREIVPELLVSINPTTAKELDIDNGDLVIVESPRGSMEAKAYLTEGIDPRVVQVPSHWSGRNNVNLIMDNENCAPMIGSTQLRCQLCSVRLCRVRKKGQR
jgi:anaerobic selenocysteine-containing dehydrogenase